MSHRNPGQQNGRALPPGAARRPRWPGHLRRTLRCQQVVACVAPIAVRSPLVHFAARDPAGERTGPDAPIGDRAVRAAGVGSEVVSEVGRGTAVTVRLPIYR